MHTSYVINAISLVNILSKIFNRGRGVEDKTTLLYDLHDRENVDQIQTEEIAYSRYSQFHIIHESADH